MEIGSTSQTPLVHAQKNTEFSLWDADGFSFGDLLDVINPLQHIPIVSTIYRGITGDDLGSAANVAGSALFGGPIGAGIAVANEFIEAGSGKNIEGHVMSAFQDSDERVMPIDLHELETASGQELSYGRIDNYGYRNEGYNVDNQRRSTYGATTDEFLGKAKNNRPSLFGASEVIAEVKATTAEWLGKTKQPRPSLFAASTSPSNAYSKTEDWLGQNKDAGVNYSSSA